MFSLCPGRVLFAAGLICIALLGPIFRATPKPVSMAFDPGFFQQVFPGTPPPPQGGSVPLDRPPDHIARTTRDLVLAIPTALQWEGRNIPFYLFCTLVPLFPIFWGPFWGPEE